MKKRIYVIQKHHAKRLHYDLRLEMHGTLKSWAIPKNPNEAKKRRILAIQTENHPLGYEKFEGVIPEGQYGAGKVETWDKGTCEIIDKKKKKIVFKINGKKLKGKFVLVKFKDDNWLFFKKRD